MLKILAFIVAITTCSLAHANCESQELGEELLVACEDVKLFATSDNSETDLRFEFADGFTLFMSSQTLELQQNSDSFLSDHEVQQMQDALDVMGGNSFDNFQETQQMQKGTSKPNKQFGGEVPWPKKGSKKGGK